MNFMNTKFGQWTYRNRSKILTTAGVTSMWGMTVYAVIQTPKAMKAIEMKKEELGTDKLTFIETVKATWMYYLAPFAVGVAGTAMTGISDGIQEKTISGLQSTLSIAQVTAEEFKEKIKEKLGEEETKKIEEEVHQEIADKTCNHDDICDIALTNKGGQLFYEPLSHHFFRSSFDAVANDYIAFKGGLDNSDGLPMNDWLIELGLDNLPIGYEIGFHPIWRGYELNLDKTIKCNATGEAAIIVDIGVLPKASYMGR